MSVDMDRQLSAVLARLDPRERQEVLAYARALNDHRDATPAPSLLDLVGTISRKDLQLMQEAIDEEFERVG
jgi:hypothetical protein